MKNQGVKERPHKLFLYFFCEGFVSFQADIVTAVIRDYGNSVTQQFPPTFPLSAPRNNLCEEEPARLPAETAKAWQMDLQNKPKQPGGQIISPCREVTSQGLFPTSTEAGGHPGRPGGLSPEEKCRISGGSPGPHYTIPACRGAHRDLLHLQPSTTLHSCPYRVMLTSWEGAEDLFNAELLTKLVLQTEASASWPSPAAVAQTQTSQNRRKYG